MFYAHVNVFVRHDFSVNRGQCGNSCKQLSVIHFRFNNQGSSELVNGFLFRKFIEEGKEVAVHEGPRGLNAQKQKDILLKLKSVMPSEKLQYWQDMPPKEASLDLAKNIGG